MQTLQSTAEYYRVLQSTENYYRILRITTEYWGILRSTGEYCRVLRSTATSLKRFWFQLLDTKSTDRKQTLLHFIANVIQEKYPDVNNFYSELHFLDKAALGEHFCKILHHQSSCYGSAGSTE